MSPASAAPGPVPGVLRHTRPGQGERGIGLFEVVAGTVVATIAVLGLAYSFGIGRGLVDRYQVARRALGRAQFIVDSLVVEAPHLVANGSEPFWIDGRSIGTTRWTVSWVDDPVDDVAGSDANPQDLRLLEIEVGWQLGPSGDTLRVSRIFIGS